jgi:hypothetical protein
MYKNDAGYAQPHEEPCLFWNPLEEPPDAMFRTVMHAIAERWHQALNLASKSRGGSSCAILGSTSTHANSKYFTKCPESLASFCLRFIHYLHTEKTLIFIPQLSTLPTQYNEQCHQTYCA